MSEQEDQLVPALPTIKHCPNCSAGLHGQFCYSCGQNQKGIDRFFISIINESFENIFSSDSRSARTLFYLLFRPGHLSAEYFSGRRARYIPPLRLYLITSLIFFFILSIQTSFNSDITLVDPSKEANQEHRSLEADIDGLNFWFLSDEENQNLTKTIKDQLEKAHARIEDSPGEFIGKFMDLVPQVMFFLLPLFTVLLKLFYFSSNKYYTEHLILAVHNHCFLFIALLVSNLFDLFGDTSLKYVTAPVDVAVSIWIPVYIYLSLWVFYQQGYFITAVKYCFLAVFYFALFGIGASLAMIWGVMTL